VGSDLLQWVQVTPIGVGVNAGGGLTDLATPPPVPPPKKERHRPNRGRKRRYVGPHLETPPWDILRETGYPIPPSLTPLPGVPSCWRRGPAYRLWRAQVHEMWGTVCHLCGHDEAHTADHLIPLSLWGNQPYDARLSRPAHGVSGCPTCKVKCNSSRGNRALANQIKNYKPVIRL
jgi:hypothetical protein